jgi:hypothetical protein
MKNSVLLSRPPDNHSERRLHERRVNPAAYRIFSRALSLRRAFGNETALTLLRTMNLDAQRAREILAIGMERRQRRRRLAAGVAFPLSVQRTMAPPS